MNSQEAKTILEMYRPGHGNVADPRLAEALEQVRRDRGLGRWFEEQRAFDGLMAGSVKSIPVPADLKASLLASRKIVRLPLWRDGRARAAMAAVILIFPTQMKVKREGCAAANAAARTMAPGLCFRFIGGSCQRTSRRL
jgi:hypothetical protein